MGHFKIISYDGLEIDNKYDKFVYVKSKGKRLELIEQIRGYQISLRLHLQIKLNSYDSDPKCTSRPAHAMKLVLNRLKSRYSKLKVNTNN